jgi:hypothetical protein
MDDTRILLDVSSGLLEIIRERRDHAARVIREHGPTAVSGDFVDGCNYVLEALALRADVEGVSDD